MLEKIGRKFIKGAKSELQEDPPALFDTKDLSNVAETALALGFLALMILGLTKGSSKAQPVTVIVNNYVNGVLQ